MHAAGKCVYQLVVWSPVSADSALILLHMCASDNNHTLIFTPGAFKVSNHYSSLNLIGHIDIPTCVTETVQQWPDPPFPAMVMQYIQSWGGSGLVYETSHGIYACIETATL